MERLTTTSKEGGLAFTFDLDVTCRESEIRKIEKLGNKLKDYEDAEEQCIAENQCGISELLLKWKAFFDDITALYDYRKADEQGLLLRLPCKVGDTVYVINKKENLITKETVRDVQYRGETYQKGQRFFMNIGASIYFENEFGKIVFLTREAAEAALAEKGGAE